MKKSLLVLLTLALFACTPQTESTQQKNYVPETPLLSSELMTPEVLWSFGRVGSPQVSPDGESVIYTVTYYHIEENKSYRDIYLVAVSGGESKNLTDSPVNESNAIWHPDGKKIGYLSSASGSVQLWEMNPDGSGANQVSNIDGGISGFKYSPSGSKIFYIKSVKLDNDIHDLFPDLPKANARLENDIMYRHWDQWHDYTYQHIFIADYSDGRMGEGTDIMKGERYDSPMKPFGGIEQIVWSPDGKMIAYTCKKKTGKAYSVSTNSDIYFYEVETGRT
ncbi:MAG: peptidase S9, partial [Mariniphaga sp.]|nr:peptidase S9 [Mariniphaga sp.]